VTQVTNPWEALPSGLVEVLRPELPGVADEIIAEIGASVPAYARPLEGAFGRGVRGGVDEALQQFLALVGDATSSRAQGREVYRALGRGEWREGRSLDALLAAYRVGARVAWRRLARAGTAAGVDTETMNLLAEAIFAYIDELSAESVEGYAEAQALAAGERQRRRQRLLELLLTDPTTTAGLRRRAADEAEWALPERAAVVVVAGDATRLAGRVGPDVLGGRVGDAECVVMPDAEGPGRGAVLVAALRGRAAAIGPAVPLAALPDTFRWARAALALGADGPLRVDDRLAALIVRADPALGARLREQRLAPLDGLPERSRARLAETLAAWLDERGNAVAVAKRLHVHPQTVRYRLAQLRDRFGDALEDPEARFELQLALRSVPAAATPEPRERRR
jgi:PucR C-terminal helix-turn-helix domain